MHLRVRVVSASNHTRSDFFHGHAHGHTHGSRTNGWPALYVQDSILYVQLSRIAILYVQDSKYFRLYVQYTTRAGPLVQWSKLPAWKIGDRGFEPQSGLQVSK